MLLSRSYDFNPLSLVTLSNRFFSLLTPNTAYLHLLTCFFLMQQRLLSENLLHKELLLYKNVELYKAIILNKAKSRILE